MKYCTLLTTAILALSPVISFADDSGQPLFGTEPVIISEQVVNDEISPKLLEDYSFYVGKWRSDEKFLTIDATGKDTEGGQIAYDSYGNITLSYSVGGFIVMAVPAGSTYPHDASIGDTTKDRLYLIHDYPYPIVLYREADYLAMIAGSTTGISTSEENYGRGGAYLVDRATAQVYANDPDTGQPYSLEKLLELGTISEEEYLHYATLRQAWQEEQQTQIETVQATQGDTTAEAVKTVQEEKVIAKNSNKSATETKKVLPRTADMPSLLGISGFGLVIMAGLGLKKKK